MVKESKGFTGQVTDIDLRILANFQNRRGMRRFCCG